MPWRAVIFRSGAQFFQTWCSMTSEVACSRRALRDGSRLSPQGRQPGAPGLSLQGRLPAHGCACTLLLVRETHVEQESWSRALSHKVFNRAARSGGWCTPLLPMPAIPPAHGLPCQRCRSAASTGRGPTGVPPRTLAASTRPRLSSRTRCGIVSLPYQQTGGACARGSPGAAPCPHSDRRYDHPVRCPWTGRHKPYAWREDKGDGVAGQSERGRSVESWHAAGCVEQERSASGRVSQPHSANMLHTSLLSHDLTTSGGRYEFFNRLRF
jgi:hypothetical protein